MNLGGRIQEELAVFRCISATSSSHRTSSPGLPGNPEHARGYVGCQCIELLGRQHIPQDELRELDNDFSQQLLW